MHAACSMVCDSPGKYCDLYVNDDTSNPNDLVNEREIVELINCVVPVGDDVSQH